MRTTTITLSTTLALACSATPASEDEANVTTAMSESSGASTSESGSSTSSTDEVDGTNTWWNEELDISGPLSCDVWMQDCPEGQKCVPYSNDGSTTWNDYKCVDIAGDQAPGEPCTWGGFGAATDDCDATSVCFDVEEIDGQLVGTCYAQCTGSPADPMCDPGSNCAIAGDGVLVLCITSCDPLLQDCEPGLGCFWVNDEFSCVPTTEDIPTGQPCGFANDCAAGSQCAEAGSLPECNGASCCTAYCDLAVGDAGCVAQPGTVCAAFYPVDMAPAGYENVGVCVLP
jgi:hypothetical protein